MISEKIEALQAQWETHAAKGEHAEAYAIEQEMDALERQAKRDLIQAKAVETEARIQHAKNDAKTSLEKYENHKHARVELERLLNELEENVLKFDGLFDQMGPAFTKCLTSWHAAKQYDDPLMQEAYKKAMGPSFYPSYEPLRLQLRLSAVINTLRNRTTHGLSDILNAADARF